MGELMSEKFMRLAVKEARQNIKRMSGGPFGACVVKNERVIAVAKNTVLRQDATCHAEINAIRQASRKLGTYDLSGCVIYSTTEPCPMCFSAIHWARIKKIVYGTRISDAKKIGFNELSISAAKLASLGKSRVKLTGGILLKDCQELFKEWSLQKNKVLY